MLARSDRSAGVRSGTRGPQQPQPCHWLVSLRGAPELAVPLSGILPASTPEVQGRPAVRDGARDLGAVRRQVAVLVAEHVHGTVAWTEPGPVNVGGVAYGLGDDGVR